MNYLRFLPTALFGFALLGCGSISLPASATIENGPTLLGTATAEMSGKGSFNVSNDALSCSGEYDAFDRSRRISMPIKCSDGRSGTLDILRLGNGGAGTGTFVLNDGTTGTAAYGTDLK